MTDAARRDEEVIYVLWRLLVRDTAHNLREIVAGYYAGTASVWSLSDRLVTALHDAHSHATYLGRRLAGDRRPYGRHDQDFAASVMIGQGQYLRGLVSDILTGRYPLTEQSTLAADLVRRLGMYAARLRGTANQAWSMSLPEDAMIEWVLGQKEHCRPSPGFQFVCTELAAGGPYPAHAMPTQPGAFETPCLGSCDCHTVVVGGGAGFPLVTD